MKGTATGARGNDIVDGSEVKSCCRLDQSDKCKNCNKSVLRNDSECPLNGILTEGESTPYDIVNSLI